MRIHFDELFIIQNNMLTPRQGITVQIGGVTMNHGAWMNAGGGVIIGGVDMSQLVGRYLQAEQQNGVHVITGIF
jgi:hypothetical protein